MALITDICKRYPTIRWKFQAIISILILFFFSEEESSSLSAILENGIFNSTFVNLFSNEAQDDSKGRKQDQPELQTLPYGTCI